MTSTTRLVVSDKISLAPARVLSPQPVNIARGAFDDFLNDFGDILHARYGDLVDHRYGIGADFSFVSYIVYVALFGAKIEVEFGGQIFCLVKRNLLDRRQIARDVSASDRKGYRIFDAVSAHKSDGTADKSRIEQNDAFVALCGRDDVHGFGKNLGSISKIGTDLTCNTVEQIDKSDLAKHIRNIGNQRRSRLVDGIDGFFAGIQNVMHGRSVDGNIPRTFAVGIALLEQRFEIARRNFVLGRKRHLDVFANNRCELARNTDQHLCDFGVGDGCALAEQPVNRAEQGGYVKKFAVHKSVIRGGCLENKIIGVLVVLDHQRDAIGSDVKYGCFFGCHQSAPLSESYIFSILTV